MRSTRLKFVLGERAALEETRTVEFKEVKGPNPIRSIVEVSDEYAVSFLNAEGGQIFWGIRDADHVVVGVALQPEDRDRLRKDVAAKLNGIQPQIDPTRFRLTLHSLVGGADNLVVVELAVPCGNARDLYFTSGHNVFVRTEGVKQKLSGPQMADWIRTRAGSHGVLGNRAGLIDPALISLVHRIRRIFSAHCLGPAHWARFFEVAKAPFSIEFTDLQSDATLVGWLSEKKIQWISQMFMIRREWIDGEDERISQEQSYDKDPNRFFSIISAHTDALLWQNIGASPEAWFLRWGQGRDWVHKNDSRVFVIVRVPLARLSDELVVYKYISDFQPYPWSEGRTAVQLRAWVRLLHISKGLPCFGREVSHDLGREIWNNGVFLHDIISDNSKTQRCRDNWHPEDHALTPRESAAAKPDEFFPAVIAFLKLHRLPHTETRLFDR